MSSFSTHFTFHAYSLALCLYFFFLQFASATMRTWNHIIIKRQWQMGTFIELQSCLCLCVMRMCHCDYVAGEMCCNHAFRPYPSRLCEYSFLSVHTHNKPLSVPLVCMRYHHRIVEWETEMDGCRRLAWCCTISCKAMYHRQPCTWWIALPWMAMSI